MLTKDYTALSFSTKWNALLQGALIVRLYAGMPQWLVGIGALIGTRIAQRLTLIVSKGKNVQYTVCKWKAYHIHITVLSIYYYYYY